MRVSRQPNADTTYLEAQLASDVRWLAAMLRYLGGIFAYVAALPWLRDCALLQDAMNAARVDAQKEIRVCVHDLRFIITEKACARMRRAHGRTFDKLYPGRGAGSVRARRHSNAARRLTSGLLRDMHRGTLRERVKRLQTRISNIEPLIQRALKRLTAIWRFPRLARHALIVTRVACESCANALAPAAADTS